MDGFSIVESLNKINSLEKSSCLDSELEDYKSFLYKKISGHKNEIKEMNDMIDKINIILSNQCEKKNNGHKWVKGRDEGPYGESFTYCQNCNCDYYDRSYRH